MMADDGVRPYAVFISYAGPDRGVAAALGATLDAAGIGVWWDAHLRDDEPFERQIQQVLSEVRIVVAVLSPRSLASEWVRWELSQASRNGLHIVPLLVDDARPDDLPPPLDLLPTLSAGGTEAMDNVAAQIRAYLDRMARAPNRPRENDARRRLAAAAARTARQASEIKQRRASAEPPRPIVVGDLSDPGANAQSANRYSASNGFAAFLRDQQIAIAFSSFQTDELYLLGHGPNGQLVIDVQIFRKPTGLFVRAGSLHVGTLAHLFRLENILRPGQLLDGMFTHCYVARAAHFTGVVATHDVAQTGAGETLFVATRYNCLATTSPVHSFRPVWRPPFIAGIVAEDRCHLNGLALEDGIAAYATAASTSDSYDAWRDDLDDGGVAIDIRNNEIVCAGLSHPHSPRVRNGLLWLLNSGRGELGCVDRTGCSGARFRPLTRLPGFTRGLAFHAHYALVGLSRPRYDDMLFGVPEGGLSPADPWCGFQVIDLLSGHCVHWFRIDGVVREIYDVAVLPRVACPRSVSPAGDDGLDLITVDGPCQI